MFIQDGLRTMTSTVYPNDDSNNIVLFTDGGKAHFDITKWDLKV